MRCWPILHVDVRLRRKRRKAFLEEAWDVADRWGGLCVVDRYGQRTNRPNIDLYQELSRGTELWLDTGPVHIEDLMDNVIAGVHRVTVRWDHVWDLETLEEGMGMVEDGFYVGIPFRDDAVPSRRGGMPDVDGIVQRLQRLDAGGLLLIDLDRAGTRDHFRAGRFLDPQKAEVPVAAAGGVRDAREVRQLFAKGYQDVLVGTARDEIDPEEVTG